MTSYAMSVPKKENAESLRYLLALAVGAQSFERLGSEIEFGQIDRHFRLFDGLRSKLNE